MTQTAISTRIYHGHLDDNLQLHQHSLDGLKLRLERNVESEEDFDAACVQLFGVHSSNSTVTIGNKPLEPCLKQIQGFVVALSLSGCRKEHKIAIWTIVMAVLESGYLVKDKRGQVIKEIIDFAHLTPSFEQLPEGVYKAGDAELRFSLADLFGDTLSYFLELLKMVVPQSSSKLPFKKLKDNARTASLDNVKLAIKTHKEKFDAAALVIGDQLLGSASGGTTSGSVSGGSDGVPEELENVPEPNYIKKTRSRFVTRHMVGVPTRNREFYGREDAIEEIHAFLNPSRRDSDASGSSFGEMEPSACIVHGVGGVGKTQTATQYAWQYANDYKWVFWVRAETETELLNSYMKIGKKVGINNVSDIVGPGAMERVQEWLETYGERWLMVFDNVDVWEDKDKKDDTSEDWEDISRFWPRSTVSASSVIVTTQKPAEELRHWSENTVHLKQFDATTGTDFILNRIRQSGAAHTEQRELASRITEHVGGLPLYLNQAAGFMRRTQSSLNQYLEELKRTNLPQLLGKGLSPDYDKPLNAAFGAALSRLTKDAKRLLYIIAFLNPEWVPESMLFSDNNEGHRSFLRDDYKAELIAQLRDGQLVSRGLVAGESCLITHRSIQLGIRISLEKDLEERRTAWDNAAHILSSVLPEVSPLQQPDEKAWATIEKYLPHLQSLDSGYEEIFVDSLSPLKLAKLFSQYGMDFWDKGLIKVGEKLMRTAENILSKCTEPAALELRANVYIILGMFTDKIGIARREEGLAYRNKAYKLRRELAESKGLDKISRNEDVLLHNAIQDVSCSYQQFNRFDKVEEISQICFRAYETWGSAKEWPYEYAKYFHSMAYLFVHRRETKLAVEYAKAASELMRIAGQGTVMTTGWRFDYAITLFQDGQVDQAIKEHESIANIRIRRWGKAHASTVNSYLILGIMNYLTGDFETAENWLRRVLTYYPRANLSEESVARAKYYLSMTFRARPALRRKISSASTSSLTLAYCSKTKTQHELESMPRSELADLLFEEAESVLDQLLPQEQQEQLLENRGIRTENDRALLYDFMAPWEYRVVTKQIPEYAKRLDLVKDVATPIDT